MRQGLADKIIAFSFDPLRISDDPFTQDEVLKIFREYGAVWLHDGDPEKPHAELTSGKHSNGYFNCPSVLCDTKISTLFAHQLLYMLGGKVTRGVEWVIGSPYAAITFSHEVARILGAKHGFPRKAAGKKMVWKDWQIPKGSKVLQIEELITTLGTTMNVRESIFEGNEEEVVFQPTIGAIVHRPPELPVCYEDEIRVVSLIETPVWAVDPEECPLCAKGSEALRPRGKGNWEKLTA